MQKLALGANAPLPGGKLVVVARHNGPDTDLSGILLTDKERVRQDEDLVCYANTKSVDGSVVYGGKKKDGANYVHELLVDLAAVPATIEKVSILLTIDPDAKSTFAKVGDLVVTVFEDAGGTRKEVVALEPRGTTENAFIIAELYRRNGSWKVKHLGQGFNNGLEGIATAFGVTVASDDAAPPTAAPSKPAAQPAPQPAAVTAPPPAPAPAATKLNTKKPAPVGKLNLVKGSKIKIAKSAKITATAGWDNTWLRSLDYDLFCHIAYKDGSKEIVKFDNLVSRNGSVRHSGDLRQGGAAVKEQITVDMTDDIACVGFSLYSALENGQGSFAHAKARVAIDNGEGSTVTIGVTQMSVDANRYTLYFGTVMNDPDNEAVDTIAVEDYSDKHSERQVVLESTGKHRMDAGPENYRK